jgi:hypothetical protein
MTPVVKKVLVALKNRETDYLWHKYSYFIEFEPGRYFHFKHPNGSVHWAGREYFLSGPPDSRNSVRLFDEKDIVGVSGGLSKWEIFRLEGEKSKKLVRAYKSRQKEVAKKYRSFLLK